MTHLTLLAVFAVAQIALGLYIGRRVSGTSEFFVAGRRLSAPMLFATLLAANIGAGSTIGAASYGYRDGLSAWWWVGSAAIGSVVLGLWVGPAIRRIAADHDLRTLGDFLEWRYDWRVRAISSGLLWIGTVAILGGQLLALSRTLEAVAGWPRWIGAVLGGLVVVTYFTAGGMRSSVWVNLVQLTVKVVAFVVALPFAFHAIGGYDGLVAATDGGSFWSPWRGGASGWIYLAMLGPSFFLSPGILQKVYGARDDRAARIGVLANAAALFAFAFMPVLLGMIARGLHPGLPNIDLALPTLLVHDVPLAVGSLGLAGLVSAEISAADAALFMLATSLSQDLYKRFGNPAATDAQVLRVARLASVACGAAGIVIALISPTVGDALKFFYTLLSVSLFVPVVAGLASRRTGPPEVLAAILGGVAITAAAQLGVGVRLPPGLTPAVLGLIASVAAWAILRSLRPSSAAKAIVAIAFVAAGVTPADAQVESGRTNRISDAVADAIASAPTDEPAPVDRPASEQDIPPTPTPTWRGAFEDSLRLLVLEHGIRVAFQDKTRRELRGPFFADYRRSVRWPKTWEDGDSSFVNYIGHPIHGAASGFVWLDHEDGAHDPELGFSWAYWASRGRATAWAAGYSLQFEFGPLSEASIGNVGLRPETTGWVDHVVTPAGALGLMVAEDALDRYFIQLVERRTSNRVVRASMRMLFNPSRTMSNTAQGRLPWARPTRPLGDRR